MKDFFKRATAPIVLTLALAMGSLPAFAGKDFIKEDLRKETTEVAQLVGQRLSQDKLTFVVHGGAKPLLMAAYNVAQRLDEEGVPVAFLLAPDLDDNLDTTHIEFYAKGGTQYNSMGSVTSDINGFEQRLYEHALKAYREDFPQLAEKTHPLRCVNHMSNTKGSDFKC